MNRLKELRLAHGYKSQKDLANILFVNQTAVSQWERGVTMPSNQMLLKLSQMYGVSIDYLLGNDDVPYSAANGKKEQPPAESEELDGNIIKIAGRDGSFVERKLTDAQMTALMLMLDQLPDAEDL